MDLSVLIGNHQRQMRNNGENNPMYGKHHTKEARDKIGAAQKDKVMSEETRKKISENNGRGNKGKVFSDETKKKISESMKGKPSNRKGVKLSDDTKEKLRVANLGKTYSEETRRKVSEAGKGKIPWNKGKTYSSPKQSLAVRRENNPNWKGGISFEPYPEEWVDDLRDSIRKRDSYVCQVCGIFQDELIGFQKKLHVHHIDYNKKNLDPNNLISLCNSCHMKTGFNREYWMEYFNG